MKLPIISLIVSSIIIPLISPDQQEMGAVLALPEEGIAEASVTVDDTFLGPENVPDTDLWLDEGLNTYPLHPAGNTHHLSDTTRQKRAKKADDQPTFQKPKVSGKTSKRKARKAKTSWH